MNTDLARALAALGIDPSLANDGFRAAHPFVVAVLLAMRGFRVMPTRVQSKVPHINKWAIRASTDPRLIVEWQRKFNPNFSILTGRANNIFGLDIDGEQGRVDLSRLEAELGSLPPTWRCNSGRVGGGYHIFMRPPPGDEDLKNQQPIPGHKIDIRGWHGHLLVSGSVHAKSGNSYSWAPGCAPDEIQLAECPPAWWSWLPKKEFGEGRHPRRPPSTRRAGPKIAHDRDPASLLIGDGDGFGGFQNPIFKNAIRYFQRAGADAPAEHILETLREMIDAAPKGPGRDVSRYMSGLDLPRQVERAREFVKEVSNDEYE